MKISPECYPCLQRLVSQAATLATDDVVLRQAAVDRGLAVLDDNFSCDEVSIVVATKLHDLVKEITGNPDPYYQMKQQEIALVREFCRGLGCDDSAGLGQCLRLAVRGNIVDFFRPVDIIRRDMSRPIEFAIDDSALLVEKLRRGGRLLYLADNAGEVWLDLPLLRLLRGWVEVTYVVKAAPVQNDVTLDDIRQMGLVGQIGRVITTGTATPGVVLSLASPQFLNELEAADLVFAKGMGYYESLSELPAKGKVFYCFMAKCYPVANAVGLPLGSFIAMFR